VDSATTPARSLPVYYAGFRHAGGFLDAPESLIGTIRPFALIGDEDMFATIDDLAADEVVLVHRGSLLHNPSCQRAHRRLTYADRLIGVQSDAFSIRVILWPPPVHPKAVALYPEISCAAFNDQPHLFRAESYPGMPELSNPMPDALCTYRPGDGEWSWRTHDLVQFLDFAVIYLAKHAVWVRSGGDLGGVWLGRHASHAARDLVRELDPDGECRCGRGTRYRDCHLRIDVELAARGAAA
jgi:hypothetical protein